MNDMVSLLWYLTWKPKGFPGGFLGFRVLRARGFRGLGFRALRVYGLGV